MKLQRFRRSATLYVVPGAPYCDAPVPIKRYDKASVGHPGIEFQMKGPCRRCPKCLFFRRCQWRDRITDELQACADKSSRSWFIVLTFDPIHLAGIIAESYRHPAHLSEEAKIERTAYRHVKGWLKRLRKAGGRFRYFACAEYGEETGRLHYHVLLSETALRTVTKRMIEGQWRSKVAYARLTYGPPARVGAYVSKYLTKALEIRPRASLHYGSEEGLKRYESQPDLYRFKALPNADIWPDVSSLSSPREKPKDRRSIE